MELAGHGEVSAVR